MSNSAALRLGYISSGCFIIGLARGSYNPEGNKYLMAS